MDVVGTLHRSVNGDAAVVFRHRDDAVRLDVELLLVPHSILAFDNDIGHSEAPVEVAFVDGDLLETSWVRCPDRSEVSSRGIRSVTSASSNRSRFSCASSRIGSATCRITSARQARLVIVDQRDDVSARNVAVIDDGESAAIEIKLDADQLSRRDARADGPSVQKTWKDEVVYITCCAGCLCNTLFAQDVSPDGPDATHLADYRRKRSMSTAGASTRRATSILEQDRSRRDGRVGRETRPSGVFWKGACVLHA